MQERSQELISLEQRYGAHNYDPLDIVVARGEGVWIWDVEGRRYLDCVSAYSALNHGHCHPRIRAALVEQSQRLSLTSRAMYNDRLPSFLERLSELTGYDAALPMNSGVEAFETAVKLARRWGYECKQIRENRAEIVVFENNFHGRTIAAISASSTEHYRKDFGPFVPGFVYAPFDDVAALERAISPATCAVVVEPIQGEGGVIVPADGYLTHVRRICREKNILFVADEIQTGLGRTGDLFACDHDNVRPDILIVGKALGGGYYPVSAILANRALMDLFGVGDHGSTFGGNPLAASIAYAALDTLVDENLPGRARQAGEQVLSTLRALDAPYVKDVRGRGLLVGIECNGPARALADALLGRGIAAKETHETVLRIAPPLVIDDEALGFLLGGLADALTSVAEETLT